MNEFVIKNDIHNSNLIVSPKRYLCAQIDVSFKGCFYQAKSKMHTIFCIAGQIKSHRGPHFASELYVVHGLVELTVSMLLVIPMF